MCNTNRLLCLIACNSVEQELNVRVVLLSLQVIFFLLECDTTPQAVMLFWTLPLVDPSVGAEGGGSGVGGAGAAAGPPDSQVGSLIFIQIRRRALSYLFTPS